MKYKILLVEDDKYQAELIAETLQSAGYSIYHFTDADSAWEWLKKEHPVDLLICDVQLPGLSGTGFCSMVRGNTGTATLPILMLTVLSSERDKVEGLYKGADDYLTKPFSRKELVARVEALLRRYKHQGKTQKLLAAEDLQVDLDRTEVMVRGQRVDLLPKEYALLTLLLEKRGRVLSHRFIAEAVWGYEEPATYPTLKVWISNLRKKLGPLGSRIETVTNQGYRFL